MVSFSFLCSSILELVLGLDLLPESIGPGALKHSSVVNTFDFFTYPCFFTIVKNLDL